MDTKKRKRGGPPPRYLYMVSDMDNEELPLFVGTLAELSEFTGVNRTSILSAISHAKSRGSKCKYSKIGLIEEDI